MRIVKAAAAAVVLLGLLLGVPWALITVAPNLLTALAELPGLLSRPDYGGILLTTAVLPAIAWVLWAIFVIAILLEAPSAFRGVKAPQVRGLAPFQSMASGLLIALIGFGGIAPATAATGEPAQVPTPASPIAQQAVTKASATAEAEAKSSSKDDDTSTYLTHTVVAGESLWDLAEKYLGDGSAWKKIAELNYGIEQPGGYSLDSSHWIDPGWKLTIPVTAEAAPSVAASTASRTYTVKPGDTLSAIAAAELGDADRFTELAELNKLSNPDIIEIGQEITLPATDAKTTISPTVSSNQSTTKNTSASAATNKKQTPDPAPTTTDAPAIVGAPEPAESTTTSAPTEHQGANTSEATDPHIDEDTGEEQPGLATIGGIGAILATGLLGLIGARRWTHRKRRKPSQKPVEISQEAETVEARLRDIHAPVTVEGIDHTLKHVALWAQENERGLPELLCVKVQDDQITLFLTEETELPGPFTPETEDHTVWSVTPATLENLSEEPAAPFPALVTIGQDADQGHLLFDLEYFGSLGVQADPVEAVQVLNAAAVELATAPWAEHLTVSLVGAAPGLPAAIGKARIIEHENIDQLITELTGQANTIQNSLSHAGHPDLHHARLYAEDVYGPHVVLLAQELTPEHAAALEELTQRIPRLGIATITAGTKIGPWNLISDPENETWNLEPIGLQFNAQMLSDEEHFALLDLLASLNTETTPAPEKPASEVLELGTPEPEEELEPRVNEAQATEEKTVAENRAEGQDTEEQTTLSEPLSPPPESNEKDDHEELSATHAEPRTEPDPAPHSTDPLQDPALTTPPISDTTKDDAATNEPATEEPVAEQTAGGDSQETAPAAETAGTRTQEEPTETFVSLLGPVEVLNWHGQEPLTASGTVSAASTARCVAMTAWLALHPESTTEAFNAAFWPNAHPGTAKAKANRNKLTNLTRNYLGQTADGTVLLPPARAGVYALDPAVRTDWHLFQDLIKDGIEVATDEDLLVALRLVRGIPFQNVKERNYLWAEQIRNTMIDTIADVAHEVVTRGSKAKDYAMTKFGAHVGKMVDPANEQMWRDCIMAEYLSGNRLAVEKIVAELNAYLETFQDEYDPEPETQSLLEQLKAKGYAVAS